MSQLNKRSGVAKVSQAETTPQTVGRPAFISLPNTRWLSHEYDVNSPAARLFFATLGTEHVERACKALSDAGVNTHISTKYPVAKVPSQPILEGA